VSNAYLTCHLVGDKIPHIMSNHERAFGLAN
jgi:hypothetical protein